MKQSWDDYERAAEKGPLAITFKLIGFFLIVGIVTSLIGYGLGWFGEAAAVAKEEFGPREALRKYEWFKDAAAQLEKKQADIGVYRTRMKSMEEGYDGKPRSEWAREDREQWNVWTSEVAGVTASYNTLAAEYNSQMSKFNWRFANAGDLPQGADKPLPREFKAYEVQ